MKDTLYRIIPTMKVEEPELSGSAMITCNGGILFAELHPVRIKAKVNKPCEFCELPPGAVRVIADMPDGTTACTAMPRYCFNCGRQLQPELEG